MLRILFLLPVAQAVTCAKIRTIYSENSCCNDDSDAQCLQEIPDCSGVEYGQVCIDNGKIYVKGLNEAFGFSDNHIILKKHIVPDTNGAYDFGSAEYKIRHLFKTDS